jgi:hypothetical protein
MKQFREKKIGNAFVVLIKLKTIKSLFAPTTGKLEMDFIFVNSILDRRQRGGQIRRGLKAIKKREASE